MNHVVADLIKAYSTQFVKDKSPCADDDNAMFFDYFQEKKNDGRQDRASFDAVKMYRVFLQKLREDDKIAIANLTKTYGKYPVNWIVNKFYDKALAFYNDTAKVDDSVFK